MQKVKLVTLVLLVCFTLFHTAVSAKYDPNQSFQFLKETYDRHDRNLRDYLIVEMDHYLQVFPEGKHASEVQYMLGKVYEEKGSKGDALASFLKLIFLYPESSHRAEAADFVRKTVATEKRYAGQKEMVNGALDQEASGGSFEDRYFEYLNLLEKMDNSSLSGWALKSGRDFIRLFPGDKRNDKVLLWICNAYAKKGRERDADICYSKFSFLYPSSPHLPQVLYRHGMLLYKDLKKYDEATDVLKSVYTQFPEDDASANALFLVGEIKEERLKDYPGAIQDYRNVLDNYPTNEKAADALWNIAEINRYKLKDYDATIRALKEFAEKFKEDPRGMKALEGVAEIHKKTGDYAQAAEAFAVIADVYPEDDDAPQQLFDACYLWETRANNPEKALSCYQQFLEKFPSHRKVKQAKKRMQKFITE